MGLMDLFGKKNVSSDIGKKFPYYIKAEFVPYRLKSRENSSATLMLSLKNLTEEPVMCSVVVNVPKQIGLDSTSLSKEKEIRLGMISPNEERSANIELYSSISTEPGEYTLTITSFVHYRDYAHVLNSMRKRVLIEAV